MDKRHLEEIRVKNDLIDNSNREHLLHVQD
jgi:hypothetical protein